ncbi:MAG: OsmC family protein [Candidatus Limnocylindria bacterium]
MADDLVIDRVRSVTTSEPGRSLNSARTNHFVIDSARAAEAVSSIEAFLAGVSSCGVNVVDREARQLGYSLREARADIESVRPAADTSVITSIALRFALAGVTREQAEELVAIYKRR